MGRLMENKRPHGWSRNGTLLNRKFPRLATDLGKRLPQKLE